MYDDETSAMTHTVKGLREIVRRAEPLRPEQSYRAMGFIRQFEETALKLSQDGEIAGSIHLCLGQEAIPVGAVSALREGDLVLATYRGHGWALAMGSNPLVLLAEIAQRAGGVNGGRAGSPLLSDPDTGFLGENSIVGAGIPISSGVAMALQARAKGGVVLTSFGDGAMNQGSASEGMIFAAARNLPVIFLCENNGWSEMTPTPSMVRGEDLAERPRGMGIESHVVDGGDPMAVARAVAAAAEVCRAGAGPVFLECKVSRLSGHYNRDVQHYRPQEDSSQALAADPLARFRATGEFDSELADRIDAEIAEELAAISLEVIAMPTPDPASVTDHILGAPVDVVPGAWGEPQDTEMTYWRAINTALKEELSDRDEMLVYGEDVGFPGGIFGVTRNLQKEFGVERVFDTPISESAILGSAVGSAMTGMRPVVEIMWADFVFVALDQIINQASNVRYINRSRLHAPLTIRMQQGVTDGACAQHAQNVETVFAHIPGIKVGVVSKPADAYAMTRAAIADPDPTILIESRALYQDTGVVPTGGTPQRAEGAVVRRSGGDVTIITWGAILKKVEAAAELLQEQGISATVLDLRWLRPLDDDGIAAAVTAGGGRVVVVHEDFLTGGFGAEIAARISEHHFSELVGPVVRIGSREVRIPSAPSLQSAVIPSIDSIVAQVRAAAGIAQ